MARCIPHQTRNARQPVTEWCPTKTTENVQLKMTSMFINFSNAETLRIPKMYSIQEIISFRHNLKITGKEFEIMQNAFQNYRKSFFPKMRRVITEAEQRTIKTEITLSLNKLTFPKFDFFLDEFARLYKIDDFSDTYASAITKVAFGQWAFAPLYAFFTCALNLKYYLPNDLIDKIKQICFDPQNEVTPGQALFIGFLCNLRLTSVDQTFDFLTRQFDLGTVRSLEAVFNIAIACGKLIDNHPKGNEFFNKLKAIPRTLPSHLRFKILDLLEAREKNWMTSKLLPQIPHFEFPSVGGDRVIHEFNTTGYICPYWSNRMTRDYLISLLKTDDMFNEGCDLIHQLNELKYINKTDIMQIILDVFAATVNNSDFLNEHSDVKERFGAVFMEFIVEGLCSFEDFGSPNGIPYNYEILLGILREAVKTDNEHLVHSSSWMIHMKFRPTFYSHLEISYAIDEAGMIDCWPIYDAMASVTCYINNDESPESLRDLIENQIEKPITQSIEFAEFVTETLVIFKPEKYVLELHKYVLRNMQHCLEFIEQIGMYYNWSPEMIAGEISGISKILNYSLTRWKRSKLRNEVHREVVKFL
ncbi:MIF4G domain containing protein [Histomonas meleagridis]|uniref:MIF4G domain containing protein n=1 Tax=Histomonas meleagridis TaxID=135588 RepID=UPI003559B2E3|nr:MIF4G domain containing protein [Histomonas meleagridis]KAH0805680.1 MIF4G domain containing protein [Histomonas meleagridis]